MKKNKISPVSHASTIIPQPSTVYIIGPTASGKSALALWLAEYHGNAEIVCADSQTIRRRMDIGTAKPSRDEQAKVKHHCLDVIDPYDDYSLKDYTTHARGCLEDIHARNKLAIVVGGSGLYVDALYFNFSLPELDESAGSLRAMYEQKDVVGLQKLIHERGLELPRNNQNKRHLINVLLRDGNKGQRHAPNPEDVLIGLSPDRDELWERLSRRTDEMFQAGFIREVQDIVKQFGHPPKTFDAIAYRIVMRMLDGELSEQQAKELIHIAERQYAKRQMTWFKRNEHIRWFTEAESAKEYLETICTPHH